MNERLSSFQKREQQYHIERSTLDLTGKRGSLYGPLPGYLNFKTLFLELRGPYGKSFRLTG